MKSLVTAGALAAILFAAAARPAHAWETSTHVGLAEQAALAGDLDGWLRALGLTGGMFDTLTIPPEDAPALFAALARHPPIDGYTPDTRGQQTALAWLLAGAAIADANPAWASNHFFDPTTGKGWGGGSRGWYRLPGLGADAPPDAGVPAPDWAASASNPMGLTGFLDQYEKAIRAGTPGERARALAGALVAAGAVMHVLGDLGSPSHARADVAAHRAQVSDALGDTGARFERLVAIGWGRLGVPAAATIPSRPTFRAFFTAAGDDVASAGLADWTAAHFFSEGTLPRAVELGNKDRRARAAALARSLRRAAPVVSLNSLHLVTGSQHQGTTLRDARGTCLARYHLDRGALSWSTDDDCELEQAAVILPVTAGYEAALLRWLSRGQLAVSIGKDKALAVAARGSALGAGTLTLLAEDGRGLRTELSSTPITAANDGGALASSAVPAEARVVYALYRGVDGAGEPIVAVGRLELP